jgi:hypothetical protein
MQISSMQYADIADKDGKINETWMASFNELLTQLQNNLSNEGYLIPGQDSANVAKLATPQSSNALLVDSDTQELLINKGGVWHKILTTPY